MSESKGCIRPSCGKTASMKCPTCLKLGLPDAFFCSQECFKEEWAVHKNIHKIVSDAATSVATRGTDPACDPRFSGYRFSGKLRPGRVTPMRSVPANIERPDYADDSLPKSEMEERNKRSHVIETKTPEEIEMMRKACRLGREVLDVGAALVRVGATGEDIDRAVHEACIERGCYPSPLNYHRFPKSCCVSRNEVICHGIPDDLPFENGDIVNLDISVYYKGFHGDLNETFPVGTIDEASKHLIRTTYECLDEAIKIVRPGMMYREVGNVISRHATKNKCSVVRTYCGHGIGRLFHSAPNVPHYSNNKAIGTMKPGHIFTIEPMINAGTWHDLRWPDDWTAVTQDGKRSAQFEHTLVVTETGCEVLTARTDSVHFFERYGLQ
eukprot:TRINITY_DN8374_c0_g1_i1.p1 TRINITY_DN8374_c0_g1~~TRINITY_DN8374_c0_g1_i1.p1  ORF type:complete len:382 (+),score=59.80 TRINITY_DN8374_c0_g1_i1:63-1208(+)